MDAKLLEVKMVIKALVITAQNGMDITTLDNEYYEQEGAHIPFQQFGFSNLNEFLVSINDSVRFDFNKANQRVLFPIHDASTAHIRKFVEEQRPQAIKRRPAPVQNDYGKRSRNVSMLQPLTNSSNRMIDPFPIRRNPAIPESLPPPAQLFNEDFVDSNNRNSSCPGDESYEEVLRRTRERLRRPSPSRSPPNSRSPDSPRFRSPNRRSPSPYRRPRSPSPRPRYRSPSRSPTRMNRSRFRSPSRSPPRNRSRPRTPSRSPSPRRSRRRSSPDSDKSRRSGRRRKSRSRDRSQERRRRRSSRERRSSRDSKEPKKVMVSCEVQTDMDFQSSEPPKESAKADNFLDSIATNQTFFDVAQDQNVSSSMDTSSGNTANYNNEPMDMDLGDGWSSAPAFSSESNQIIDWSDAIQPIPEVVEVPQVRDPRMNIHQPPAIKPVDPRLSRRNSGTNQQQTHTIIQPAAVDDWGEPSGFNSVPPPTTSRSSGLGQRFSNFQASNDWGNSGWDDPLQQSTVNPVSEEQNSVDTRALFANYQSDPWSVFDYYFCTYGEDWYRTGLLMPPDFEPLCEDDPLVPHPNCQEEEFSPGKYFNYETGRYDDIVMIPLTFFDFIHSHYFIPGAPRPPPLITPQKPTASQPVKKISLSDYLSRSKQPAVDLGPPLISQNPVPMVDNNQATRDPRMRRKAT